MKSRTVSMPGEMSRETGRETAGQAAPWKKCPECGGPYMVEKWLKAGPVLQCPNADCKHKQPMLVPVEALAQ